MAGFCGTNTVIPNRPYRLQTHIRCTQVILQHSKITTDNLVQYTSENAIDILFLQEPYTIRNKIVAIPNKYKIFSPGEDKPRAAIEVTNNLINTLLIQQL
jgi:uncharacterized membrane protein (UPF0127 family)